MISLQYVVRRPNGPGPYPTVIVLHGYGADEYDLLGVTAYLPKTLQTISLQGTFPLPWGGYSWYHLEQTPTGLKGDDASRYESIAIIKASLASLLEKEQADTNNIFLMGFSQGAAMAYTLLAEQIAANMGIEVKGVLAMSGYIPADAKGLLSKIELHNLPIFISHGEFDELIPHTAMTEATEILNRSGATVTSHVYPIGHGIGEEAIEDLRSWYASNFPNL